MALTASGGPEAPFADLDIFTGVLFRHSPAEFPRAVFEYPGLCGLPYHAFGQRARNPLAHQLPYDTTRTHHAGGAGTNHIAGVFLIVNESKLLETRDDAVDHLGIVFPFDELVPQGSAGPRGRVEQTQCAFLALIGEATRQLSTPFLRRVLPRNVSI